jgi:hypothetical protein
MRTPLNELARQIEADTLHIQAGKICAMDDIASAPRLMKENKAGGTLVVLTRTQREFERKRR